MKKRTRGRPEPRFRPAELLSFVELKSFTKLWKELGLSVLEDLSSLQVQIMVDPQGPPVIPGTGGVRKLRFSPPTWDTGSRGALRVCYRYFQAHGIVALALVYPKSQKDDLSSDERQRVRRAIEEIELDLDH